MLHRLFSSSNLRLSEADLRSHLLLHGDNSAQHTPQNASDIRIIIAQDLGDKSKVILLDTQPKESANHCTGNACAESPPCRGPARKSAPAPRPRESSSSPELLTELMFGTVPLSYKGTSIRVHPLTAADDNAMRSFLFTKVFTVPTTARAGSTTPGGNSSCTSTASSYSSSSGFRSEYPFPMTALRPERSTDARHSIDRLNSDSSREEVAATAAAAAIPLRPPSSSSASETIVSLHQPQSATPAIQGHQRNASSSSRADPGGAVPYVPFIKADANHSHESYVADWLPSPGFVFIKSHRSGNTTDSTSPGSLARHSRYQPAMCAIGVVFTVPGTGHEPTECVMMNRCWQMLTRATHALQRSVYNEIELALRFVTSQGAPSTSLSKSQTSKGVTQMYQRGKRLYVALGRDCLQVSKTVALALDNFRTRLHAGLHLPELQQTPLVREADTLISELSFMVDALDRKEAKFMFFTLLSFMTDYVKDMQQKQASGLSARHGVLRDRIVVVTDDPSLARRLIFCLARLFFRESPVQAPLGTDYALVWPSKGILCVAKKDLPRPRQSSVVKTAWDIPHHSRPLSTVPHHIPPISSAVHHRSCSTASNTSSRGSSWKPSWSWFSNRSSALTDDVGRSETKSMHTSWNSSDFADLSKFSRNWSPQSWSSDGGRASASPLDRSEEDTATDEDDEGCGDSIQTARPDARLNVQKATDGVVEVPLLGSISFASGSDAIGPASLDEVQPDYPLTGLLSRFHPDMMLQAVPCTAFDEGEVKRYLSEEDLYTTPNNETAWTPSASITIAELGHAWRLRKITRLTRPVALPVCDTPLELKQGFPSKSPDMDAIHAQQQIIHEESWNDDVLVDLYEPLRQCVLDSIRHYKATKDTKYVQSMIDSLPQFSKH